MFCLDRLKVVREVKYDPFATSLDTSVHFVVRYLRWHENGVFPFGYVSEMIKPQEFERYYSLKYNVPSQIYS